MRFLPKKEPKDGTTRIVRKFAWLPEPVWVSGGYESGHDTMVTIWLESYLERQYWHEALQAWIRRESFSNDNSKRWKPIWDDVPEIQHVVPWWWKAYTLIRG